jgi:hypothetical protein
MFADVLPAATRPSASIRVGKITCAFIEFFYTVCYGLPGNTGIITYFCYSTVTDYGCLLGEKNRRCRSFNIGNIISISSFIPKSILLVCYGLNCLSMLLFYTALT